MKVRVRARKHTRKISDQWAKGRPLLPTAPVRARNSPENFGFKSNRPRVHADFRRSSGERRTRDARLNSPKRGRANPAGRTRHCPRNAFKTLALPVPAALSVLVRCASWLRHSGGWSALVGARAAPERLAPDGLDTAPGRWSSCAGDAAACGCPASALMKSPAGQSVREFVNSLQIVDSRERL
jgi:hypothetical protein